MKSSHSSLIALAALWLPQVAAAQQYAFSGQAFAPLNPALLTRIDTVKRSEARVGGGYELGGWANYGQGDWMSRWGADVQSVQRLSAATVVSGSMSYTAEDQHRSSGSAWIDPTYRPFDIVEDSLNTAGNAHTDRYSLMGSVATKVVSGLNVGARVEYHAANSAKQKDLRHKNRLMQLAAIVGTTVEPAPWLSLGAHYRYGRQTESITFTQSGKSDRVYVSLISYGAMMGRTETFSSGNGLTESGRDMPFVENSHGGGATVSLHPGDDWQWTVEGEARHLYGYYGRNSPYTIVYMRHNGDHARWKSTFELHQPTAVHRLKADLSTMRQRNYAQTYRSETTDNGATKYDYYAPVETGTQHWSEGYIGYEGALGTGCVLPTWTWEAGVGYMDRSAVAMLYPYYRQQHLHHTRYNLSLSRTLAVGSGWFTAQARAMYLHGGGAAYTDATYTEPSDLQAAPATMSTWLEHEVAWLTQRQNELALTLRYTLPMPHLKLQPYAEFHAANRHACGATPTGLQRDRTTLTLHLGCWF